MAKYVSLCLANSSLLTYLHCVMKITWGMRQFEKQKLAVDFFLPLR